LTQKKTVNAEICIWKALTEKRKTRDLEKAAREIAKKEYGLELTHNKFHDGMKNLKKEKLVIFDEGDYTSKMYQINPEASDTKVQLLELVAAEYAIIKRIRKEANDFEARLKDFASESVENKKLTQLIVNNRKKLLLARIKWLTLIQNEGDCPKFIENEITVQKEHAEKVLKKIHDTLKKLDDRLAAQSSASLWNGSEREMGKIANEHTKLMEQLKIVMDKSSN